MIIDEELEVVRGSFEGGFTLIHGIPILGDMGTILEHVAAKFFEPPIPRLSPYEYPGKAGVGVPYAIPRTTTLGQIKRRQKYRRVGVDRLSLCGKADLSKYLNTKGNVALLCVQSNLNCSINTKWKKT